MQSGSLNSMMNNMQSGRQEMPSENSPQSSSDQDFQEMYPDLYQKIKPHIDAIANELKNQNITVSMLEAIVQDILSSGEMPEYEESQQDELGPAVPAMRNSGYQRYPRAYPHPTPYYRPGRYPGYYNNPSIDNLLRLMLLQRLGGYYYYY